jgi:hypothetical protein
MGFESSWAKTTDVVRNHYGPREVKDVFGGQRADSDGVKTLEFTLSASDFSSGVFSAYASNSTGVAGMDARVPAGALIKACRANVTTAFSGGSVSVLDVGLEQSDGTDIDPDGLIAGASASASTAGWVVGAGADIGTIADATEDGYLLVSLFAVDGTTPAAATAGEVTIIIEYLDENKDGSGRYTAGGVKA